MATVRRDLIGQEITSHGGWKGTPIKHSVDVTDEWVITAKSQHRLRFDYALTRAGWLVNIKIDGGMLGMSIDCLVMVNQLGADDDETLPMLATRYGLTLAELMEMVRRNVPG